MKRPRKSEPIDPSPQMLRGETAFEEKRIECEFTLTFPKIANAIWNDMRSPLEFAFRQGYFTGKAAEKRASVDKGEL